MIKKNPVFNVQMLPIAASLPQSAAASIGRTIAKHSEMQAAQSQILRNLLNIDAKQARVVIRINRPRIYVSNVEELLALKNLQIDFAFNQYAEKLDAADTARNNLAHSLFLRGKDGKVLIQIVRGVWDLPQEYPKVKRSQIPAAIVLDRKYLLAQRKAVDTALESTIQLVKLVVDALHTLNRKRRRLPALDRRHRRLI